MACRTCLLAQLQSLNEELRRRGAFPTYELVAGELLTEDQLRQAVKQTLEEVLALREET